MNKAYKATYNSKCLTLTYEQDKTYTFKGKLNICSAGFHYCENPTDTLVYYPYTKDFILMEVEPLGETQREGNKSVTNKLKINKILSHEESHELIKDNIILDKNNNLIHTKNSNGYEYWQKFDKNNNKIHFKDSNGIEYWQEFDNNNNKIHFKNSSGYEYWYEYDKNNNCIHYKSSSRVEEWQEFDKNNNLIHTKNSNGIEYWQKFDKNNNLIHFKNSNGSEWSITIE
jgi:hypothetical protein